MLSDAPSSVLKEAQNLGVKVISEKTFLTFDRSVSSYPENRNPLDIANYHNRRRFTTTDIIMNKDLIEQLASMSPSPRDFVGKLVEHPDESMTVKVGSTGDDVRRSSICSQLTLDFEVEHEEFKKKLASDPSFLCVQTPMTGPVHMLNALKEYDASSSTTVMIRNIPNRYTQDSLISLLHRLGFTFNFFYCPIDRNSRANCGYFFVNLVTHEMAQNFMQTFQGLQLPAFRSNKVCEACWARLQGYSANVDQYRDSPLAHLPREFRPRIFKPDGTEVPIFRSQPRIDELKLRKVFVGGLSPSTSAETIRRHLSQFGEIEDVSVILDSGNKASRGFAFVTFVNSSSVLTCVEAKTEHFIEGRSLGIRPYSTSKA